MSLLVRLYFDCMRLTRPQIFKVISKVKVITQSRRLFQRATSRWPSANEITVRHNWFKHTLCEPATLIFRPFIFLPFMLSHCLTLSCRILCDNTSRLWEVSTWGHSLTRVWVSCGALNIARITIHLVASARSVRDYDHGIVIVTFILFTYNSTGRVPLFKTYQFVRLFACDSLINFITRSIDFVTLCVTHNKNVAKVSC